MKNFPHRIYTDQLVFIIILLINTGCTYTDKSNDLSVHRTEILENIQAPEIPSYTIRVTDFGAIGNAAHNSKKAFDKALENAKEHGGARIIIPEGTYFIGGPLHLVDNICLDFEPGARLKFSCIADNYLPVVKTSWEGTFLYNYSPYIYGYDLKNITIRGKGIIDGNAKQTFAQWSLKELKAQLLSREMNNNFTPEEERIFGKGHFLRPQFIQLYNCKNILIEDITITDSPFWCIHLLNSSNAIIQNITFDSNNLNSDGIVMEYSQNILVQNNIFKDAYDNISIKSGRDADGRKFEHPSKNILVKNCKLKGENGIAFGSEMSSGIENVIIENCSDYGHLQRGVFIKTNPDRGGYIQNIFINNLKFGQVEECINISTFFKGEGHDNVSNIHDIYIENIECKKANRSGITIHGFPEEPIRNISLKDIRIIGAKMDVNFINAENIKLTNVSIGTIIDTVRAITR